MSVILIENLKQSKASNLECFQNPAGHALSWSRWALAYKASSAASLVVGLSFAHFYRSRALACSSALLSLASALLALRAHSHASEWRRRLALRNRCTDRVALSKMCAEMVARIERLKAPPSDDGISVADYRQWAVRLRWAALASALLSVACLRYRYQAAGGAALLTSLALVVTAEIAADRVSIWEESPLPERLKSAPQTRSQHWKQLCKDLSLCVELLGDDELGAVAAQYGCVGQPTEEEKRVYERSMHFFGNVLLKSEQLLQAAEQLSADPAKPALWDNVIETKLDLAYLVRLYCCKERDFTGELEQKRDIIPWSQVATRRAEGKEGAARGGELLLESIFVTPIMELLEAEVVQGAAGVGVSVAKIGTTDHT